MVFSQLQGTYYERYFITESLIITFRSHAVPDSENKWHFIVLLSSSSRQSVRHSQDTLKKIKSEPEKKSLIFVFVNQIPVTTDI